jgi:transcriptional regulator with XRE-family HTH domain
VIPEVTRRHFRAIIGRCGTVHDASRGQTELLRWARERSMIEPAALAERFPRLDAWEQGDVQPTLKQLEGFANATHAPIGYFFLSAPPVERMPIPDFRTVAGRRVVRPSLICWTRFTFVSRGRSGIANSRGPSASGQWPA